MKISLSLFCFTLAMFATTGAEAQYSQSFSDQYYEPSAFQPVAGDILGGPTGGGYAGGPSSYGPGVVGPGAIGPGGIGSGLNGRMSGLRSSAAGRPGRFWFQSNIADQGLGYQGTYLTVGGKNRLFEDRLDGRWLVEGQVHHSLEDQGGLFANIGVERVFTLDSANADISVSGWYDYDGDTQGDFAHEFHQVGITAQVKTKKWDVIGNGYFPVGVQDYSYGDPSGRNPFVGNRIVVIPGVDSALEGFDVAWRVRPSQLAIVNGTIDLGGYSYSSELVNSFGGGRVRLGIQAFRGMIVSAEVNNDNRFNTTGVLSVGWVFGANASGYGSEYAGLARDLESVNRNDHIVRFNQQVLLATDPNTGAAYNAIHVNNTADPAFEDGTAERPYATLKDAEALSSPGDVIVVAGGDGTDRDMDKGILLQDNQKLLGYGRPVVIPSGSGFFQINADPSGISPTISNAGGFSVVQMASNNEIAGINVDGTGARFGIWGNGRDGNLHDNIVENATEDGVRIATPTGDYRFVDNVFRNNGRDGLYVYDAFDTTSNFTLLRNTASGNTFDGIHFYNYDPETITIRDNITSNNFRHGLFLENYLNSSGNTVAIFDHVADSNAGRGIFVNGGDGNLRIYNPQLTNNAGAGINITNWTNINPLDNILIDAINGGTSNISGNGAIANVEFFLTQSPGSRMTASITNTTLDDGVRGVFGLVEGLGNTLNVDVLDNLSISNNLNDGVRMFARDSGTLNTRIGSTNALVPTQIVGNASGGGAGISFLTDGGGGQPAARLNGLVENVFIDNAISQVIPVVGPIITVPTDGVSIVGLNNSVVDITVRDSTIGSIGNGLVRRTQNGVNTVLNNDGNQLVNRIRLDTLSMFSDTGVNLTTGTGTFTDFTLQDSVILPNGLQSTPGVRNDNNPFADGTGDGVNGIVINATGSSVATGTLNALIPIVPDGYSPFELVSDALPTDTPDNITVVNIDGNRIQDFTLDGVTIATHGDAEMLLTMRGNDVSNNGAGANDDADNDNAFGDQAPPALAAPDQLLFYDGVNIDAFDVSVISTNILGNTFRDNFERGLSLNTFNGATINACVNGNSFFGNDRGEDADNTLPPVGTGTAAGPTPLIADAGQFDFEAINNEEFYIRPYESTILINPITGVPVDATGADLPGDTAGVPYEINTGVDAFGNVVAFGVAHLNLSMSQNALQLGPDMRNFAVPPGEFTLGLDGNTNGFTFANVPTGGISPITPVALTLAGTLKDLEAASYTTAGFDLGGH